MRPAAANTAMERALHMTDFVVRTKVVGERWLIARAHQDERGQGMVEYALVLIFVSMAAVGLLGTLGGQLVPVFNSVSTILASAL